MSLPVLPSITQLSSQVVRILGGNPGKFTLQGTNTYVIGHPSSLLLFDTAQGLPEYLPLLRSALAAFDKPVVSDIILSHWHEDHVGGLPGVLGLLRELEMPPPRVWKFPCGEKDDKIEAVLGAAPAGTFVPATTSTNLHSLSANQTISRPSSSSIVPNEFKVLHTPGHTSDSISLFFPSSHVLFTADTVLGHGTAVFESLSSYMSSLEACIASVEVLDGKDKVVLYPGHGEVVAGGLEKLKEYVRHRMEREGQVLESMRGAEGLVDNAGGVTAEMITNGIYAGTIPDSLIPAATRGILLHLEKLLADSKVERIKNEGDTSSEWMPGWSDSWKLTEEGRRPGSSKM